MPGCWRQLLQHARVHRRVVSDDLDRRALGRHDGPLEEPASCPGITPWGDEHVDNLAGLVDSTIDIAPPAGDLHIGLVDPPAGTGRVPARTGGVSQQRGEPLHPPVDDDVVDLHASLGEELFDVAVGQSEA